jgi:cytochrome oxidase Cu insertion factor (SCO1/SenC/PrrC family)
MNNRLVLRLAFIAAAAFAAAVGAVAFWPKPERAPQTTAQALIGGPFTLTDAEGKRRTDAEFSGKHMLVFFGFANCPDFCPTALVTISQAMEKLGPKAEKLVPIFITVDPERDTPAVLKNYGQNFDKRILMLTGSAEDIAAVARAYRVYYAKRPLEKAGEYTMDHSAYIYLIGPGGKYVTHFRHAIAPDDLARALAKQL